MPESKGIFNIVSVDDLSVCPGLWMSSLRYDSQLLKYKALKTVCNKWFSLRSFMGKNPNLSTSSLFADSSIQERNHQQVTEHAVDALKGILG